jgi:hypothetical protein
MAAHRAQFNANYSLVPSTYRGAGTRPQRHATSDTRDSGEDRLAVFPLYALPVLRDQSKLVDIATRRQERCAGMGGTGVAGSVGPQAVSFP